MNQNNEEPNLIEKIKASGIDILKIPEYVKQIKQFFPMLKTFFPMVKEWEKTQNIKDNQQVIYSLKVETDGFFIYVFVIEERDILNNNRPFVIIADQKFKLTGDEVIEKITQFIPGA